MTRILITMQNSDTFEVKDFDTDTLMELVEELGNLEGPVFHQLVTHDQTVLNDDSGVEHHNEVVTFLNKLQISSVEVFDS